jgi:hypothetical protein
LGGSAFSGSILCALFGSATFVSTISGVIFNSARG